MTHRAYVNFWTRETDEATSDRMQLDRFQRLLETVPLSEERPGFKRLAVRAVSPAETPVADHDYGSSGAATAAELIALAGDHLDPDIELEASAFWDLWRLEAHTGGWKRGPEPLLILCRGPLYDDGIAGQTGHFEVDLGFEHLFTGPSGLLTPEESGSVIDFGAAEARDKISQNIRQLFQWLRTVEKALPIERYQLWSEGEENLEARLDEILASR